MKSHCTRHCGVQRILCWAADLSLTLGMAGCGIPEPRTTPELAALAAKTGQIESVQLTDQSRSAPVSIEEATKEAAKGVTEPNQPRPMVNLGLAEVRAAALENNLGLKVQLISPALAQQAVHDARVGVEIISQRRQFQAGEARGAGQGDQTPGQNPSPQWFPRLSHRPDSVMARGDGCATIAP